MTSIPPSRRSFLVLSGLAALSVPLTAACGGDPGDGPAADGKVTFDWWNIATTEPGRSLFPRIASAFMAAHPDVRIETTSLENEAFKSKLTATPCRWSTR